MYDDFKSLYQHGLHISLAAVGGTNIQWHRALPLLEAAIPFTESRTFPMPNTSSSFRYLDNILITQVMAVVPNSSSSHLSQSSIHRSKSPNHQLSSLGWVTVRDDAFDTNSSIGTTAASAIAAIVVAVVLVVGIFGFCVFKAYR